MGLHRLIGVGLLVLALARAALAAPATQPAPLVLERAADSLWVRAADGTRLLDLLPEIWTAHAPAEEGGRPGALPRAVQPTRLPLTELSVERRGESWRLRAVARSPGGRYTLDMNGAGGRVEIELRADYARDLLVRAEALRFRTGAVELRVLDRAYRWVRPRGALHVDALTPHLVRLAEGARQLSLIGGDGVQGLWVRPGVVEAELDHEANHPFRPHRTCITDPRRRVARDPFDATLRRAGSSARLKLSWAAGALDPVLVGRFPRGYRAALVLTDHADQSDAAKLEALAFGATGALARRALGADQPGLVNRGLSYTKSIFLRRARRYPRQLDDPAYSRLLDELARRGVEIAVHSPTGWRDRPAESRPLLAAFRAAHTGRVWIDHQPTTNCEALSSQGWDPRSPYYFVPLLAQAQLTYAWAALDLEPPRGSLNLLSPDLAAARRPLLYRHAALGDQLVLFAAAPLFTRRTTLLRELSDGAVTRLEQERGLLIGHVYLDTYRAARYRERTLLVRRGPADYALRPEIDALFVRLSKRQAAGDLWVAGIEAVADHLLAARRVTVTHLGGGVLRLVSPVAVRRLTLLLPEGAGGARVDGNKPSQRGREVWFDLSANRPRRVDVIDSSGRPLALYRATAIAYRQSAATHKGAER
jgi:hypothetical protein